MPDKGRNFWQTVVNNSLELATLNPLSGLNSQQIAFSAGVAIIVGCAVAILQTYSIPHRVLRKLKITNRTSEVGIWEFTFNSPGIDSWVTVRHHGNGKVYQGWVRGYSDGGEERELLLLDVKVFAQSPDSDTLLEVDNIPVLYLGLDRKNAILELTRVKKNNI